MLTALRLTGRAIAVWWREFALLIFLNLAWFALQVPIVTGPPATAAMYAVARRAARDEILDLRQAWRDLRQMFRPAWQWGAVNLIVAIAVVGNFWFYQNAVGWSWMALRLAWGVIALGWFAANLFYWPFWLAQEDRSMRTTLRNAFLFLMKSPGLALTLVLISTVLIVVSVLVTLPLATILMAWLALIGVLAVDEELQRRQTRGASDEGVTIELIQ